MLHVLLDIAQFADLSNPRKVTLWIFKEETKRKAIFCSTIPIRKLMNGKAIIYNWNIIVRVIFQFIEGLWYSNDRITNANGEKQIIHNSKK